MSAVVGRQTPADSWGRSEYVPRPGISWSSPRALDESLPATGLLGDATFGGSTVRRRPSPIWSCLPCRVEGRHAATDRCREGTCLGGSPTHQSLELDSRHFSTG